MGKALGDRHWHVTVPITVHAPIRAHLAFRFLRAIRLPEHVALDLVWEWFAKK